MSLNNNDLVIIDELIIILNKLSNSLWSFINLVKYLSNKYLINN